MSVGSGWVAAVMRHVLGTIRNAQHNRSMVSEQGDLINWITEIHGGMYKNWMRDEGRIVPRLVAIYTYVHAS